MTSNAPDVLWIGPAFASQVPETHPFVSPAAVWWNAHLVRAIDSAGLTPRVASHVPQPAWPRGDRYVAEDETPPPGIAGSSIPYWNVPWLRQLSLFLNYSRALKSFDEARYAVTYNPYPFALLTGQYMRRRGGLRWICIHADAVGPDSFQRHFVQGGLGRFDARVFLSWHDFVKARRRGVSPSLHLDGGIDIVRNAAAIKPPSRPIALYTGALNQYAGVELLIDAMDHLSREIQVVICGKGRSDALSHAIAHNRFGDRLRFLGMVSEAELHDLSMQATCFVNPRPSTPENRHNFPSKLLRYLGYGRPIASTRTPGLSPDYEVALTFAATDEPVDVADSIESAIRAASSPDEARRRQSFVASRTWQAQAARLIHFLNKL